LSCDGNITLHIDFASRINKDQGMERGTSLILMPKAVLKDISFGSSSKFLPGNTLVTDLYFRSPQLTTTSSLGNLRSLSTSSLV
jgi:hypothetical protein